MGLYCRAITTYYRHSSRVIKYRPLIVGLHGSSYDCHYFDTDAIHTASTASNAFAVPFVAIDRPSYGETHSILPVPEGSTFPKETGSWLHRSILPALWLKFGTVNECNCIVLLCHSLGSMGGIIAAAMHALDDQPLYPLGGIIVSGLGDEMIPSMQNNPFQEPNFPPYHILLPLELKDKLMLPEGTVHLEVLNLTKALNALTPIAEIQCLHEIWLPTWREQWAPHVVTPVKFALPGEDCYFAASEERIRSCVAAFAKSTHAEGILIKGAPHCMELSYWSQAWYSRCFGFAMECAVTFCLRK